MEEWRIVAGFRNRVSSHGRVWNTMKDRECAYREHVGGYKVVTLGSMYSSGTYAPVHRLVAMAFCARVCPHVYDIVDHKDGNRHNNNASNLEWTTRHLNAFNNERHRNDNCRKCIRKPNGKYAVVFKTFDADRERKRYKTFEDKDAAEAFYGEQREKYIEDVRADATRRARECVECARNSETSHPASW
jgi:HNH endonuclease